jgi:hypothetical protein
MNTLKPAKTLEQSLARIDDLLEQYINTVAPSYKINVKNVNGVSNYRVVNMRTNNIQSVWKTLDQATAVMRDLNRKKAA